MSKTVPRTMTEVARRAGVSQATVSRVVNRNGYVSDEVAESVTRAIEELGYQPVTRRSTPEKKKAASPTSPSDSMIALVMLDDSMDANPTLALSKLRGVEAAAANEGLTVSITRMHGGDPLPVTLKRKDIVGVLLWGRSADPALKRALSHLPTMWLSSHAEDGGQVVLVGNEQAGRIAADYLIQHGVTRPAFLCLSPDRPAFAQRGNGFRFGLHVAGVESETFVNAEAGSVPLESLSRTEKSRIVATLLDQMLTSAHRTDGIFIPDDQITCLVYAELRKRAIEPGKDILIVSCGNEDAYLNGLYPRPATIDLAPDATGRLAVEQLLRLVRNPVAGKRASVVVTPELVLGDE